MTDKDFLEKYVRLFNLMHSKDTYASVLDLEYRFVAVSPGAATLIKKEVHEHIGISFIKDLPRPDWIKSKKLEIINKVFQTQMPHNYIGVCLADNYLCPFILICICPIKNPDTGNIVGFDLTGSSVDLNNNLHLGLLQENILERSIFHKLTPHELDILYFKCRMYSDSEVAEKLEILYNKKISPKTINNLLRQQLYPKFGVVSLIGLIEQAKKLGIDKLNFLDIIHQDTIIELPSNFYINFTSMLNAS